RWKALAAKGANVQRPLWASTSTKNPAYRDVMYVEQLIGPDIVNTMPPATIVAFRDHGEVKRTVDADLGTAEKQIQDLERFGILPAPRDLVDGTDVVLSTEHEVRAPEIPVTYENLAGDVHVGDRVLINDGLIELVVLDVKKPRVTARVLHGGQLTSHKGINLPGVSVSAPSITEKDREDVAFAVEQGIDYLALSFVRRAQDVAELRAMIPSEILVIAKIEKDSALEKIESIIRTAAGV